jgi:hypothetical protein
VAEVVYACFQVEKAWTEVMRSFPEPLHRHRYGA